MQKIEIISKQSCILCHLTFLSVQFKYSVQPCILIKLCCLIPFILKCKFIYLLLSWKWSALDEYLHWISFQPQGFFFLALYLGKKSQKERINEKIYCFTDLVSKPYSQSRGGSRIFFLGGGALVSCSTSTPINHIVFFWQNTSCIRKPQVISWGGWGAHLLHPPPRSAPVRVGEAGFH